MAEAVLPPDPLAPGSVVPDTPLQSDWPDKPAGEPPHRPGPLAFFRELPVLILIAFGLALLIKTFLIQAFYIPSESMVPTLLVGDRVLVNKLIYRFRDPHRGEIVVFVAEPDRVKRNALQKFFKSMTEGLGARTPPERDFIKRVIGLPGDTITMTNGVIHIKPKKGKAFDLKEPYLNQPPDTSPFGPYTVPANSYFLMGDNRANSSDSRVNTFGGLCATPPCSVPKSRIVGKAFITIWPPSRFRLHHIPKYAALYGGTGMGSWWESPSYGF
ncbi:MAG: signal peptidase I [Actinomycetota bacterium]|nr:signal peptidase I [Actinomycetota bacterium]